MNVTFGGHELTLHHTGIMLWPSQSMLIVSDMHLEKGSHFARRGFFLPPYDSADTLARLLAVAAAFTPQRILLLGDCFHDPEGYARLDKSTRALFDQLLSFSPIWIRGNHDKDFVPAGFEGYDVLTLNGLTFVHEATQEGANEISGHYHPKIDLVHKGARVSTPCFLCTEQKLLMPAFGSYTGGLSIASAPVRRFYEERELATAYALGERRLYKVPVSNGALDKA